MEVCITFFFLGYKWRTHLVSQVPVMFCPTRCLNLKLFRNINNDGDTFLTPFFGEWTAERCRHLSNHFFITLMSARAAADVGQQLNVTRCWQFGLTIISNWVLSIGCISTDQYLVKVLYYILWRGTFIKGDGNYCTFIICLNLIWFINLSVHSYIGFADFVDDTNS